VLAELYRRGVLAGQAARGARGIDLLTSTGPTLQVKSCQLQDGLPCNETIVS